jgi:hypothetical protein
MYNLQWSCVDVQADDGTAAVFSRQEKAPCKQEDGAHNQNHTEANQKVTVLQLLLV